MTTTRTDAQGRLYATATHYGAEIEYRTGADRHGLYRWDAQARDWRQVLGDAQFSARNEADMARKIERRHSAA